MNKIQSPRIIKSFATYSALAAATFGVDLPRSLSAADPAQPANRSQQKDAPVKHTTINIADALKIEAEKQAAKSQALTYEALSQLPSGYGKVTHEVKVSNPKHTIVYVKMAHFTPDLTEREMESVLRVQSDINDIMVYLNAKTGINSVYKDGVTPSAHASFLKDINETIKLEKLTSGKSPKQFFALKIDIARRNSDGSRSVAEIDKEIKNLQQQAKNAEQLNERTKGEFDQALPRLYKKGIFTLNVTEGENEVAAMRKAYNPTTLSYDLTDDEFALLMKAREDRILHNILHRDQSTVALLLLGGGHELTSNVKERNNKYPDSPAELYLIEPTAFTKEYSK